MRNFVIVFATTLLLVTSMGASARGYGYGHGYRHHGYGHGYGRGYRHYGSYGNGHNYAPYLVGGLLLGSILAAPPRYAPPPSVVYVPQPIASAPRVSYPQPTQASVSRRLLRDINGNCFERKLDTAGTEMRIQLPASECAW